MDSWIRLVRFPPVKFIRNRSAYVSTQNFANIRMTSGMRFIRISAKIL